MANLRELRLKMGLSQPKLAVTAKVHPVTIYNVEIGNNTTNRETGTKLTCPQTRSRGDSMSRMYSQ